jgi:hypothetical protein
VPRLDRLARRQARAGQAGARRRGVHRHTSRRGLARDAVGGVAPWRAPDLPAGTPVSLAPAGRASLEQALRRPEGGASDAALRQGVRQRQGGRCRPTRAPRWGAPASRPSARGPGPVTPTTPEARAAGPARARAHLPQALPPANTRPLRVFRQDERRVGLVTSRRRRLTARGVPPMGAVPPVGAWCAVEGAVAPTTGARCCRARPALHAGHCPRCVARGAPAVPDRLTRRRRAQSGAHTAPPRTIPAHVGRVSLPPDGPELHPSARVWRDGQDALAGRQCPNLDERVGTFDISARRRQSKSRTPKGARAGHGDQASRRHRLCENLPS